MLIASACTLDTSGLDGATDAGETDANVLDASPDGGEPDSGMPDGGMIDAGPPTCDDAVQNGDETDVDCGGDVCAPCDDGFMCVDTDDCSSLVCMSGTCVAANCADSVLNGDETDVDCGGSCLPCVNGQMCLADGDCESSACMSMICVSPDAFCADRIQNRDESDVDCGGTVCLPCADGLACTSGSDCVSLVCDGVTNSCSAPSCADMVRNGVETDVDCGGSCGPCADGAMCAVAGDCTSGVCQASTCVVATCGDGVRNGTETDVDCGGACGPCADGGMCGVAGDCTSGVCSGGSCAVPTCTDMVQNGTETDVDCGGSCGPCADGAMCSIAGDCTSGVCTGGSCAVPSCSDLVLNGTETDLDCGGSCGPCADGAMCSVPGDCTSGVCSGGSCAVPSCSDLVQNGTETDVDCGGSCGPCADGAMCSIAGDCTSGVCSGGSCSAPTCSDLAQNGTETDVDCGGSCSGCADGGMCSVAGDCTSGVCTAGSCSAPSCSDLVLNGTETDVDCGGSCGGCADGAMCSVAGDCTSGVCTAGSCTAPSCGDGVANGTETDIDCGGSCTGCPRGAGCGVNADCLTNACASMLCVDGPTAGFTVSPTSGDAPLLVTATSTATAGDSAIVLTEYDWGDGSGFVTSATVTYTAAASYTVTQRVTDANGFSDTTTQGVSVTSFTPVRLSDTDRGTDVILLRDGLEAENRGGLRGGARSNVGVTQGSGVFYYEAERLIARSGVWGYGVATAAASLDDLPGQTIQSAGVITEGDVINPGGCTGASNVGINVYNAGFVLDYSGTNPVMHLVIDQGGGPQVVSSCTMTGVTAPVFIFYSGARFRVGSQARFNTGNDTTNFPFFFTSSQVSTALTNAGHPAAAAALVMGWGQTRARTASAAPVLSPPADMSVSVGTPVSLMATATDAEDGSLTASIEWADLSSNHFVPLSATGGTFSFTPTQIGNHPIRIRVEDSFGVRTEHIMNLDVTGTLTQFDPVEMIVTGSTGSGITVSTDNLSVRYSLNDKRAILANQGCYGDFWYFEATRSGGPFSIGVGLAVDGGDLDPYDFDDPMWSMSINTLGDTWQNLINLENFPNSTTTYGFAVDYRTDNPTVYIITDSVIRDTIVMDQTWLPLYPFMYGGPTTTSAPAFDMTINFGASAFSYNPTAVLTTAGIDASALEVGWGDANTP